MRKEYDFTKARPNSYTTQKEAVANPPVVQPTYDVRSVTEFRVASARLIAQMQVTKRPLFLTLRGQPAAVMLDIESYAGLLREIAVLRDVHEAEHEIEMGEGLDTATAAAVIRTAISSPSPLDVPGLSTRATSADIVAAARSGRRRVRGRPPGPY